MKYDVIIIGAGASGMTTAALLSKRHPEKKISVLEAHFIPGGCSSYFERNGYCFDAGATTLSGLAANRPLSKLFEELDIQIDLKKIDPGIVSILGEKRVHFYSDPQKRLKEIKKHFPQLDSENFWNKILKISDLGWSASSDFPNFPLYSPTAFSQFLTPNTFKYLKLIPALNQNIECLLSASERNCDEYKSMLSEMLFITAQNDIQNTPALMGSMGLTYAEDTYYSMGGMRSFSHALASKCQQIHYRHKVIEIKKVKEDFEILTNKGIFLSKNVVSTLPVWNHRNILKDIEFKPHVNDEECWSAFMLYFTIPLSNQLESLYYQIHTTQEIPLCETHSFFVSLSHPDDKSRTPNRGEHKQTVTISTHTKVKNWEGISPDLYAEKKAMVADFILQEFSRAMKIDLASIENLLTGSPRSFMRFTSRHRGLVGGVPHSIKRSFSSQVFAQSPIDGLYLIGDTQFPGQGIPAVARGAMALANYLDSKI